MTFPVFFRPHHFLCTLGFQGMGYSPAFVDNFKETIQVLNTGALIHVTLGLDTLCKPCPNHNGTHCNKQMFIESLDGRHAKALHLKHGDQLTWKEALLRIQTHMSVPLFHSICQGCPWKDQGMCEKSLRKILKKAT